ncbi:MAG: EI24 domain-containing protein [Sulfurovum sp.]|nr:EI24 domain-containing protein [Sulfurovum sp.]
MIQIIGKSFKDIFSLSVLVFVLKVTLISLAISVSILWLFGANVNSFIASYLSFIPWEWLQTTGASVVSMTMIYMIFIMMISIVTSFMVEPLLIKLAQKHYPHIPVVGSPKISTSIWISLKSSFVFLLIFFFTFPLMFIPLLGAVYMLWLWSILLKKPALYDVSSLFIQNSPKCHQKEINDVSHDSLRIQLYPHTQCLCCCLRTDFVFTPYFG